MKATSPSSARGILVAGIAAAAAAMPFASPPSAAALPEGYAYEMVSPPDKNDGDVGAIQGPGTAAASPDGDRIGYLALGGFDAPISSATGAYLATRGDESWQSNSFLLPMAPLPGLGGAVTRGISEDATRAITATNLDEETGEAFEGNALTRAHYLVDAETGERELLRPAFSVNGTFQGESIAAAGNADFSRVFFQSAELTDETTSTSIYLHENGTRILASRLPDESPVGGQIARGVNGVAREGEVLYFIPGGFPAPPAVLYRRDFGGASPQTVLVNADENSLEVVPPGAATFAGASDDGEIAYFTSAQRLVDEDTDSLADVYRYEHSQPEGSRLTLVSADAEPGDADADSADVHVASGDGSTVAFSSQSQLIPGQPTAPGSKLYLWRNGELSYVANTGGSIGRDAQLTADGSLLAFRSNGAGITPEDNGGLAQVYLHNAGTDATACVSCTGGGEANTAAATLEPGGEAWLRQPATALSSTGARAARNLSSEGHVFFHTAEPLIAGDTNGKIDVYAWQDGVRDLISSGRSGDHSRFADASVDGSSVFFTTREKLSGWDVDDHVDMYAARLGGGLPEPASPGVPCAGSECQGPPALPPPFADPDTGDVEGAGNPDRESADCTALERRAERLAKKAKRLANKASKASGERRDELEAKARKAKRKAKKAKQQAKQCAQEQGS